MNSYNIQMVSKLTGISIHTLRAWEKRYQAVVPLRDDSGRRAYNDKELEKLKLLGKICSLGGSIGNLANLETPELKDLMSKFQKSDTYEENAPVEIVTNEPVDTQKVLNHLLLALQDFKLDIISHELHKLKITMSTKELAFDVLIPLLQEIGFRVNNNTLTIAQEHALSSIIRFHLANLFIKTMREKEKKVKLPLLRHQRGNTMSLGYSSQVYCVFITA